MEHYLHLIAGLAILLIGGDFLVRAGVSLAGHFKVSALVVGVTVVSFGTSAPELVVSLEAAISNHPDIALGNVIGSNISNIGLVLAITVLITPYFVNTFTVVRDWLVMIFISLLLILFLNSGLLLSRMEGFVLLVILVVFVTWTIRHSRRQLRNGNGTYPETKYSVLVSILIVVVSSIALVFGAQLLVRGASEIASTFGISERVISVSVLALGTSLPELATSAVAAARKQNEISIGNIIGSNIFNILAILGITASISPIRVESREVLSFDLWYMLGISFLLMILILPLKGSILGRWKGMVLVVSYVLFIYLVYL
ncbi:MAG: calcium/sodium antiporter [Marinilabiliaceae bacterium]|jgi:cation:H+ antiporter|nr:calcium/sodium antiporter [Marinilabiliaceae bacterium]